MIKKYKQFLNESDFKFSLDYYTDLREELYEVIKTKFPHHSFADKANNAKSDPDYDYNMLLKITNNSGLGNDIIKKLFSEKVNNLLNQTFFEFIESHDFNNLSGYVDLYIYKTCELLGLDKNHFILGGNEWANSIFTNGSEAIIRYNYGIHKTKYGKLLLNQLNISSDKFKEMAENGLEADLRNLFYNETGWENILSNFIEHVCNGEDLSYNINNKRIKIDDYIIFDDEDRILFLTDDISKMLSTYNNNIINDNISNGAINSYLKKIYINFDTQETTNEFIIYKGLK